MSQTQEIQLQQETSYPTDNVTLEEAVKEVVYIETKPPTHDDEEPS